MTTAPIIGLGLCLLTYIFLIADFIFEGTILHRGPGVVAISLLGLEFIIAVITIILCIIDAVKG